MATNSSKNLGNSIIKISEKFVPPKIDPKNAVKQGKKHQEDKFMLTRVQSPHFEATRRYEWKAGRQPKIGNMTPKRHLLAHGRRSDKRQRNGREIGFGSFFQFLSLLGLCFSHFRPWGVFHISGTF